MNEVFLLSLIACCILCLFLWIELGDIEFLGKSKVAEWIRSMSFTTISKKLEKINVRYTITEYTSNCTIVGLILFAIVFNTIHNWTYTLILVGIVLFFLPYLNYINCMRKVEETIEREAYDYSCYALTYLRENRSSVRVLQDCQKILDDPFKSDLQEILMDIYEGADIQRSLEMFNQKYPYDEVIKLNQLLLAKSKEGVYSPLQYTVLYEHFENLEKVINNFRIQKEAKRKGFYMVAGFSLLSGYLVRSLFGADMMMDVGRMNFFYFIFYLIHIGLILIFERKYSKTSKQKEKVKS